MRVLWITPGFAAHENDSTCIPPMQLLAQQLVRQGIDLQIIALEYPFSDAPYRWHGASVFPCNGGNRRWLKWRTLWRAMHWGKACILEGFRAAQPPVVHSFWLGWASGLGERLWRRYGIPHYTTLMGQDVLPQNRKFLYGLDAARAGRLIAVSDFQNTVFGKNAGFRAKHVIPWGVEESEVPQTLPPNRPIDVLGAGSLIPVKNWEKWLNVIALAVRKAPGLRAEIVGDGAERAKLERLAQQLGLGQTVHFAGNQPRPSVLDKMKQSKVLLHTAHYESFGYVLAEAAMNGCRVVGTPVGALEQFGKTAESEPALADLLLEALQQSILHQPVVLLTMQQTAEAYVKIYEGYQPLSLASHFK